MAHPVPTFSTSYSTPLPRAAGLSPLPEMLVSWESGRAVHKIITAESPPLVVTESKELLLPLPSMVGVFGHAFARWTERAPLEHRRHNRSIR